MSLMACSDISSVGAAFTAAAGTKNPGRKTSRDFVLTIGLPLVATFDLRQLAGLLARAGWPDDPTPGTVFQVPLEREIDNALLSFLKISRYFTFGLEVVISYALYKQIEIKALRLVLAAKDGGTAPDTIKERIPNAD
mgnify:CR=1 FL=1